MITIPESLKEYVLDEGDCETTHCKYAEFYATWSLKVTPEVAAECGDDACKLVGLTIVAHGMTSDDYGNDVHSWGVYREEISQSPMGKAFGELMAHLNAEENDMASEFYAKYIPSDVKLVEVKHDL